MAANNPIFVMQVVGFGAFFWLGLYLGLRSPRFTPLLCASLLGLWGVAGYFAAVALTNVEHDPQRLMLIERWSWWASVMPLAAWFHFTSVLVNGFQERTGRFERWLVPGVYVIAGIITVVGTFGGWFIAQPTDRYGTLLNPTTGPAYPIYVGYLVIAATGSVINLLLGLRPGAGGAIERTRLGQVRIALISACLFLIGAVWLGVHYTFVDTGPTLLAYVCLLAGSLGIGYGVARYGMLLLGQDIRRDFVYAMTAILLLSGTYVCVVVRLNQMSPAGLLALVGLVVLTHTGLDEGRHLLDRFFFTPAEQAARAEARAYATVLGTTPVALSEQSEPVEAELTEQQDQPIAISQQSFRALVRKAITALKSPPQLAQSPLLALELVTARLNANDLPDNRLNRAAMLRELLIEQIDGLRPVPGTTGVGDAWRFFNVLYYPYIEAVSRKRALSEARRLAQERRRAGIPMAGEHEQVLEWLADVDEDTFYKWQRRASDTVALILWEEQHKAMQPNKGFDR